MPRGRARGGAGAPRATFLAAASRVMGAKRRASASAPAKGVGFTSGPARHKTGKTIGGSVEFQKRRLKVGKKVQKHANETETTVRSKAIRLAAQNVRSNVEASTGGATSARGTPLGELLRQCEHYAGRTRADALRGTLEIARNAPREIVDRAAEVVERVGERLADEEAECRAAARECLRAGVAPALGASGLAPFARALILYAGAALTHVQDGVRKDAPAALDALLDAAPSLVVAHAPASTLGHLAELLRRGDDGGVGSGSSTRRGVGSQKPKARLALLRSCRKFLQILVDTEDASSGADGQESSASSASTFVWGEVARRGTATRSIGSLYSERGSRTPARVLAAYESSKEQIAGVSGEIMGEGRRALRANAKRIVELSMCVWDDAAQTFADERGVDIERVRVMTESMACARLALRLADASDEAEFSESDDAFTSVEIMPELARRALSAFPSSSPTGFVEKQDPSQVREALVALNFETCRFLVAAGSKVANVALVQQLPAGKMEALPYVLARAMQYVASVLRGVVLDGGAMGESMQTPEEAYGAGLELAREALSLPAWCFSASILGASCGDLIDAVSTTWNAAVSDENTERVAQCVELLTATLPEEARQGYARIPIDAVAGWVRHIPRVLWSFKHENPSATDALLSLLHDVAARNPPGSPLAEVLSACESEMAVLFFMVPPAGSPEGAKSRPGPFARLPFPIQCSAIRLIGVLPTLTPATVRAIAKMCLDVDRVHEELPVIAVESLQTNPVAAPLELTVSFYATLLVGAPGVKFLEKSSKRDVEETEAKAWLVSHRVAPAAAAALVSLSDADAPWTGASLACGTLRTVWSSRVEKGDFSGATRTASGFVTLFAGSAEFAQSVSQSALDDEDLATAVSLMFAWFFVHASPGKGVDVDVAWRALRLDPMAPFVGSIARSVADVSAASVTAAERAIDFASKLLRSDFIRSIECEMDMRDAVRAIQSSVRSLEVGDVDRKAKALDASLNVAFEGKP